MTLRSRLAIALRIASAIVLLSCSATDSTNPGGGSTPVAVATINVGLPRALIHVGDSVQASATLLSATSSALTGRAITWSTDKASVASVSQSGLVTSVGLGTAVISASSEGVTGQATLSVTFVSTESDIIVFENAFSRPGGAIYLLVLDGSLPIQLPDTARGLSCPTVSPNGERIAYLRGGVANGTLATVDIDGVNIVNLTAPSFVANPPQSANQEIREWSIGCPAWSDDSRQLAVFRFVRRPFESGVSELFTLNADGTNLTPIGSGDSFDGVSWSPIADRLMVAAHSHTHAGDYGFSTTVLNSDGSGARQIPTAVSGLAWAPSGQKIAVICGVEFSRTTWKLCVGNPDGSVTPVTDSSVIVSNPAWSPDATRIAFGCQFALCVVNPDGTGFQKLASNATFASDPKWSPDSKRMTYSCLETPLQSESQHGICIINVDGTNERTLVTNTGENSSVSWVPRGIQ
jgi:hypothetical protein